MKILVAALALVVALSSFATGEDKPPHVIEIAGAAVTTGTMSFDELASLPAVEQDVRYQTSKGEEHGRYTGPLLWSILQSRGIADLPGHNEQLKHSLVVEGRDGYRIVFSVGEIDPNFGNAPIQLAIGRDGEPIANTEGYRLVVPGDKRGARYVRDVVRIEVQ